MISQAAGSPRQTAHAGAVARWRGALIRPWGIGKLAKHLSTRSVRLARMILIQAIALGPLLESRGKADGHQS